MKQKFNIKNPVAKPWGFEFEYFDSQDLSIWILQLGIAHKSGYLERYSSTSMHLHENKDAVAFCVSGEVEINTEDGTEVLRAGSHIMLNSGVYHQIKTSYPNTILIELESPSDRSDIKRLRDTYGREAEGYVWNTDAYLDAERHGFSQVEDRLEYKGKVIIERINKNSYDNTDSRKKFIMMMDGGKMKLYDHEKSREKAVWPKEDIANSFVLYSLE